MSQRRFAHTPGEFYHLYNRGNSKQLIFTNPDEYRHFQELLYITNGTTKFDNRSLKEIGINSFEFLRGEPQVAIGAYCLMPNHFHILVTPLHDTAVACFMKKLATAYSMYFNTKHHRTGTLFEGRYKSQHADDDRYLKYLFAYIHLNPLKLFQSNWRDIGLNNHVAAQEFLDSYRYSSYLDTKTVRRESAILNLTPYPHYFETSSDVEAELFEWMTYYESWSTPKK